MLMQTLDWWMVAGFFAILVAIPLVAARMNRGTSKDFLLADRSSAPACLLLDVRMPDRGGLEFQRLLIEAEIHVPIIFMSGHGDVPMTVRAMKDGALEFLTKPVRGQELLEAIGVTPRLLQVVPFKSSFASQRTAHAASGPSRETLLGSERRLYRRCYAGAF